MRLSDKIQTYSMYEILGLIFEQVILMWMYGILSCIDECRVIFDVDD